jgi:hypothetical protein
MTNLAVLTVTVKLGLEKRQLKDWRRDRVQRRPRLSLATQIWPRDRANENAVSREEVLIVQRERDQAQRVARCVQNA